MSETFVRLKPKDEWRPGCDKERLVEAMRASLEEIPGVRYNFSQPIKDNVEEAVSGVRGKVVLKIFGTDLATMRATLEQAKASAARTSPASSTSICIATRRCRSCRSSSTARRSRAPASPVRGRRERRSRPRSPGRVVTSTGKASGRCRCA